MSVPASSPLLQLENIVVERDSRTILTDCSWTVDPGTNWVIFGPNGAGKTSLLNVIQGYLWPSSGRVRVFGGTLGDGVDVRAMREQIPVVSDSIGRMINAGLSGLEVIVTGLRSHLNIFSPVTGEERDAAVAAATRISLQDLLEKPFSVMSTGERQRILMTRALMREPRLVILDEPCAGLDLAGREWVLQTMEAIAALPAAPSLLLTTHHAEEIARSFTHALLVNDGRIFAEGPIEQVFTGHNLTAMFGLPLVVEHTHGRWAARSAHR